MSLCHSYYAVRTSYVSKLIRNGWLSVFVLKIILRDGLSVLMPVMTVYTSMLYSKILKYNISSLYAQVSVVRAVQFNQFLCQNTKVKRLMAPN